MSTRAPHRGWLLAVLLAGPYMAQADATITNVATPSIHTDLGAWVRHWSWWSVAT